MPYIYRMENDEGIGCYTSHEIELEKMYNKHSNNDEKYPLPYSDEGINRECKKKEIHGFLDIKQAKKWFSYYEIKKLKTLGYNLKKIKIYKITAIGKSQVLAIRKKQDEFTKLEKFIKICKINYSKESL